MAKPFDVSLKDLIADYPADWLANPPARSASKGGTQGREGPSLLALRAGLRIFRAGVIITY